MKKWWKIFSLIAAMILLSACGTQRQSDAAGRCKISISCAVLAADPAACSAEKRELIPEDGWILPEQEVAFSEGESVFDVLQRVTREQKIQMEFSQSPVYETAYIEGIGNLYEFDAGALSGWMYRVNGWFPNYGCSSYQVQDGDVIEWVYTCDLGADVGGGDAVQDG